MAGEMVYASGRCEGVAGGWDGNITHGFAAVDVPAGGIWESATAVPDTRLAGQVLRYSGYRTFAQGPIRLRSMPSLRIVLFISLDAPSQFMDRRERSSLTAAVFGLRAEAAALHCRRDGGRTMMVELTPHGAYTLLGVSLHELTGGLTDLTDLLGDDARRLAERLAEATGWERRFALLEGLLTVQATVGRSPAPQVAWAWRRLHRSAGRVRIEQLAAEIGWSRQHLVTRFREQIGLAPKTAARVIRFQRALRLLQQPVQPALTDLARECGYSDQAHFTREFRALTDATPADLATGRSRIKDPIE
ncbi:helix-turn-helix transcriptional regulator [Actinomadura sp. 9N215]|uniref:helix-turn-helix transcriptional regulator n=1 Tax=Actinomadura sp. 9N215 TaxID=3375150 RepID=UPI00378D3D01